MKSIWRIGLAAAATLALAQMRASAQIAIQGGNNPQPDEENVLLNTGTSGATVFGLTQQSNLAVALSTLTNQTLVEPSNGQARVEATDGQSQVDLTSLSLAITPTGGAPFGSMSDLIFNANIGGGFGTSGTIDISVIAVNPADNVTATFTVANGSNFFTIVATGTSRIQTVDLSMPNGVADVRQVRISGASPNGLPPSSVPEPGSWAMIAGMGVPVLGLVRRLRKA